MFGPVQPVALHGAQALIPDTMDPIIFEVGTDRLRSKVEAAIDAGYPVPDAAMPGSMRAIVEATRQNRIADIMAQGAFRNAAVGFGFIDPYTNKFVAGADGKPLIFTLEEVIKASREPDAAATSLHQLGPGEIRPPRAPDPLAEANDPLAAANDPNKQQPPIQPSPGDISASTSGGGGSGAAAKQGVDAINTAPIPTGQDPQPSGFQPATRPTPQAGDAPVKDALSQAQLSTLKAAVTAFNGPAGRGPNGKATRDAITARLRKAGIPKELWPE